MEENNLQPKKKIFTKEYWIGFAISIACCVLLGGIILLVEVTSLDLTLKEDSIQILTDVFSISGILMLLFFLLIVVSNEGAFDAITYSVKLIWNVTFHSNVRSTKLPTNYAEYRALKRKKDKKPLSFIALAGLLFLLIGLIFFAIYKSNR